MLTIAGYDLPEVLHQDAETMTCRGTRTADGLRVRARFLRNAHPQHDELQAWQAAVSRLRGDPDGDAEQLIAQHPFGATDAVIVADDDRVPLLQHLAGPPLDITRAVGIARGVAAVLVSLHGRGVVHGRLCSDAVWLQPTDGHLCLVPAGADARYRAPEQFARASAVDERSDLYALGVLLYELLAGRTPWPRADTAELALAHTARKPAFLQSLRPEVPAAVAEITHRLLAKSPDDRYQSAWGLLVDLQALESALRDGRSTDTVTLGAADRAASFALPDRLYGRESEMEALRLALDRSRWGRCDPIFLRGAPGVGKSALGAALREEPHADNVRFIAGKFDQYKRNLPYSAVAEAFTGLMHQLLGGSESELQEWRRRVAAAVGVNARVLMDVVPDLELLCDAVAAVPSLGPTETRNRFNTTFRDFVRVFARADQPLVILLDDLQWADAASLSLVTTLAVDPTLQHVLLLGAYRDTEAGSAALLTAALEELRVAGVHGTTLTVGPISLADTTSLIADTLRLPRARCAPLAELVHVKTGGNPFFVRQFMQSLREERLLVFDAATGAWRWDAQAVTRLDYSDNVTALMAARLQRLSADARDALRVASCVGASFARPLVVAVLAMPDARVAEALDEAEAEGMIQRDLRRGGGDIARYRFVHDRVQQAAHGLIEAAQRSPLRRTIGRVMLQQLSPLELDDALFEVVTNLADGPIEDLDTNARAELAALCLKAGRRARASLAYEDARTFLRLGLNAINGQSGEREHGFALRSALFECSYLTSRFAEADALFDALIREAPGVTERAQIYDTKILIDTSQGRSVAAVQLGINAVRGLGVNIPSKPTVLSVLWALAKVGVALRQRRPEKLRSLPHLTDPTMTAAIGVLLHIGPAAYFNNPEAFLLSALGIVRISLRHGHTSGSSFGYVIYGMVLGAKLGHAARGQEFGRLAIALSDELDTPDIRPKVHMIFGGFVNHWVEPYQTSVRILADAFPMATEAGDLQYAGYCHNATLFLMLAFGTPLADVIELADRYQPFVTQANDAFTVDAQALMRQRARAARTDGSGRPAKW